MPPRLKSSCDIRKKFAFEPPHIVNKFVIRDFITCYEKFQFVNHKTIVIGKRLLTFTGIKEGFYVVFSCNRPYLCKTLTSCLQGSVY